MKVMYLRCNGCGKIVCNAPLIGNKNKPIIIRAWVECPECNEKEMEKEKK